MKTLNRFLIIFLWIPLLFSCTGGKEVNILVVHSYEADYPANGAINSLLAKKLRKNNVQASITFYYLDCERYLAEEELAQCWMLLDSLDSTGSFPDLVVTLDDQGTYSLLKCGHPAIKKVPVVFSGVSFPNWELLKEYPNVTGLWNKPDYAATIGMVKTLFGNKAIMHLSDETTLGKRITSELQQICGVQAGMNTYKWRDPSEEPHPRKAEQIDHTNPYIVDYPIRDLAGRNALWYISGIERSSVLLLTKRDITTYNPLVYSSYPLFTTLNEGFGFGQGILAGCIPLLEEDLSEVAFVVSAILEGVKTEEIPVRATENKYLIDWQEMKRWKIEQSRVPKTWNIVNIPFWEKHAFLLGGIVLLLLAGMIGSIIFLRERLLSEIRKKTLVQKDLDWRKSILSLLMEKGSIFTWKYDMERQELTFEKEFFESLGIPVTNYSAASVYEMVHPEDCTDTVTMLKNYVQKEGRSLTFNTRIRFWGDVYTWWEFRCAPVMKTETGGLLIAGLCLSVQEYKDREQELIEARDLAAKAELKESFLANMSHEIRTPLNAIVGFSNLLVMENDFSEEEKRQFIDSINKNCETLLKLINDILEISRIESGNMSFKFEEVSLKSFLDDVYMTHSLLMPQEVKFEKRVPEKDILLQVDRVRLNQVLTNFINNAAKFTRQGYIRIGYHVIEGGQASKKQPELCIYVEDTGKGIPKEQQQLIFNRFYKQDEFAQGTGLGLSICNVIVQRFGGYISLDSELGKGSRFVVHLPLNEKTQMAGVFASEFVREQRPVTSHGTLGKPVILIAEDHDSNYLLLKSTLQEEYEIIRVLNGEGAIKMVRLRQDIGLVIKSMHPASFAI